MPIPAPSASTIPAFPLLTASQIDATRTSRWTALPSLRHHVVPSVSLDVDELGERDEFLQWLAADSIFMPLDDTANIQPIHSEAERSESDAEADAEGSDTKSTRSRSSSCSSSSSAPPPRAYHLPNLTRAIRDTIKRFGGSVFPKLNWTAPQDAAFILPQSNGPLRSYTSDDVYLLLKSSDIIQHDLDPRRAYASGEEADGRAEEVREDRLKVELVLKAFLEIVPSREFRCFVRDNVLVGVSQRDSNYYDHLQSDTTKETICDSLRDFWEDELMDLLPDSVGRDYSFDVHLSSNLTQTTLIDINPYRSTTSSLLFSYHELADILNSARTASPDEADDIPDRLPVLRVVESAAEANAQPSAHSTNRVPIEMVELSQGRSTGEFAQVWEEALSRGEMR